MGVYFAGEAADKTVTAPHAVRAIGAKIKAHFMHATMIIVNNALLHDDGQSGLCSFSARTSSGEVSWKLSKVSLEVKDSPKKVTQYISKDGFHFAINDFDEHFDDISRDWTNAELTANLQV